MLLGNWGRDTPSRSQVFLFERGHWGCWLGDADVITDFNQAEGDLIDLSAIDAIAGGGDDAFTFIGASQFSGTAGELKVFEYGGNTFLAGDTNGDGVADFQIQLQGQIDLTMADFVL